MDNSTLEKLNNNEWIDLDSACEILNLSVKTIKEHCRDGKLSYKVIVNKKYRNYFILSKSILDNFVTDETIANLKYSEVPSWAKIQAQKYLPILKNSENLRGNELKSFIEQWNLNNPELTTSYTSLVRMRGRYLKYGLAGLISRYGTNSKKCSVSDLYFEYFKKLYLKEGAPSLRSCWEQTLGYAILKFNANKDKFPSHMAFKRRMDREVPKQSIYLARYGESAWNRKYSQYIERDYSNIICGKVWVSDHAQIDVACRMPDGSVKFPWVTAWRDYKSGKWLGWILQTNHPNSDLIFQTFYNSALEYGLPEDIIIDNGKDYRSKDFAGGRKIQVDEQDTTCMLEELNVNVHFALPYNAQTKPIERDFLKIKNWLSKHCVGYRGGNVVERPEILAEEIKNDKIMSFEDFKTLFDNFIVDVFNKHHSNGKNNKGLSPDELFYQEFTEKVAPSKDALKLFCMRTSKNFTIGRNGIKDSALGITYWADWMSLKKGIKVYLRRDIKDYANAWVFNALNDEFIGKAKVVKAVAALHADKISKEEFKEAMSIKKRNKKIAQSYIENSRDISAEEKYENYKALFATNEEKPKTKVTKIANTKMDKVIQQNKEMEAFGRQDLSIFLDEKNKQEEETLYLFETDRILAEENERYLKGVANGY